MNTSFQCNNTWHDLCNNFPQAQKREGAENKKRAFFIFLRAHFWFLKAVLILKVNIHFKKAFFFSLLSEGQEGCYFWMKGKKDPIRSMKGRRAQRLSKTVWRKLWHKYFSTMLKIVKNYWMKLEIHFHPFRSIAHNISEIIRVIMYMKHAFVHLNEMHSFHYI